MKSSTRNTLPRSMLTTVTSLSFPSLLVDEPDVPVHGDDVRSDQIEEVADAEVADPKLDYWKLFEEAPEPPFHGVPSFERAVPLSAISPG
jgi:hypothetical protein